MVGETEQLDLENKPLPDVSVEDEDKPYRTYRSRHLYFGIKPEVLDAFFAKLDKQVEKKKINASDKPKRIKAWVQSKVKMATPTIPLLEGTWDKETTQLYDKINE